MSLRLRRKGVIKITLTFWPKVREAYKKKPYASKHNWNARADRGILAPVLSSGNGLLSGSSLRIHCRFLRDVA